MTDKRLPRPRDPVQLGKLIGDILTGQAEDCAPSTPIDPNKNQAAAELGRKGGLRGGRARAESLTPEERKLAIRAANRLGLKFAGVDILRSAKGPLLLEVNSSPGLEGIERTTGTDVAGFVLDYIEHRTFRSRPRLKRAA